MTTTETNNSASGTEPLDPKTKDIGSRKDSGGTSPNEFAASASYSEFLIRKRQLGGRHGFAPLLVPDWLFPFQRHLVEWALRQGRAAIYADCGMGKTPMQLVWAENVAKHTGGHVLLITPLAVSQQTIDEAAKFHIGAERSKDGRLPDAQIVVTNYESLHRFDARDFAGAVCDESSILKNFDGVRRAAVTEFMRKMRFRLLCTATAAPNDYMELGTSSEALGEMGYMDMLGRFFRNDQHSNHPNRLLGVKWRFKGHAEGEFWRWVCSWARACRKPADVGFNDDRFQLPPLEERAHVVKSKTKRSGFLFDMPAIGLQEQREELSRTVPERCEMVATMVATHAPAVVWCHLNKEADLLEKIIPGARQVSGDMSDDEKEEVFADFASGALRVLITKPKIGAFGLNWQHCAHMTLFPSHSFEQYYQAVRRCWRYGQSKPVVVDIVTTEGQQGVLGNLQRKVAAADRMFAELAKNMNDALRIDSPTNGHEGTRLPSWL